MKKKLYQLYVGALIIVGLFLSIDIMFDLPKIIEGIGALIILIILILIILFERKYKNGRNKR